MTVGKIKRNVKLKIGELVENFNDKKYIVLTQKGDYTLFISIDKVEFIVAWVINQDSVNEKIEWSTGRYYSELEIAVDSFKELANK